MTGQYAEWAEAVNGKWCVGDSACVTLVKASQRTRERLSAALPGYKLWESSVNAAGGISLRDINGTVYKYNVSVTVGWGSKLRGTLDWVFGCAVVFQRGVVGLGPNNWPADSLILVAQVRDDNSTADGHFTAVQALLNTDKARRPVVSELSGAKPC